MRYREFVPADELREHISFYWVFEKKADEVVFAHDRFMPESSPRLIFQLSGAYRRLEQNGIVTCPGILASGAARTHFDVDLPGYSLSVGVCFRSGGSARLGSFFPAEFDGPGPYSQPWADRVFQRLGNAFVDEDFSLFKPILDDSFRMRLNRFSSDWLPVDSFLARRSGRVELDELVRLYGRSVRCFERACLQETGYTPREYRAVVRCDLARSYLFINGNVDLSDLAVSLGFFDLPHFCRTFKRWSGSTPLAFHSYCAPFRVLMTDSDQMRHHAERLLR